MRHLTVQQLSASLDGALVGVSLELVVRHLATCHECRDRHARISKQDDTLRHMLAWDPGAEFFEDASIRLETILDAESRGVATPRAPEIEPKLPRVTLDEVLRSVQASITGSAPTHPSPPVAATPASVTPAAPGLNFPDWMQREAPAVQGPVAPKPAPREHRPPTLAIEPVVLAQMHIVVDSVAPVAPVIAVASPAPVVPVVPVVPTIVDLTPEPEPVREPAPQFIPVEVASALPIATTPAVAGATAGSHRKRRELPRWVTPLAATCGVMAILMAALSALPPIIRIPAPGLPRLPRIELVRRIKPASAAPVVESAPIKRPPVIPAAEPAITLLAPIATAIPTVIAPRPEPGPLPQHTTKAPVPAPSIPTSPAQTSTQPTATATENAEADAAADWPLLCGEVLDDSGTPVVGARVMLADIDLSARTDKRGRFCLAAPPGDRTLSVIASGFTTTRQVVSLGTQTLEVQVAMRPTP